jgi:hypothetical protein
MGARSVSWGSTPFNCRRILVTSKHVLRLQDVDAFSMLPVQHKELGLILAAIKSANQAFTDEAMRAFCSVSSSASDDVLSHSLRAYTDKTLILMKVRITPFGCAGLWGS